MKKVLYAILFISLISASFTACTEESVTPRTNDSGPPAGGSSDGKQG